MGYIVLSELNHNGQVFKAGHVFNPSEVDIDQDQFDHLVKEGILADEDDPKAVAVIQKVNPSAIQINQQPTDEEVAAAAASAEAGNQQPQDLQIG